MGVGIAKKIPVAERRTKAVQMRLAGLSYNAIAAQLNYASPNAASKDICRTLAVAAKAQNENAEQLLQLEIDRLDRMMAGLWTKACAGDVKSVEQVEKLIYRRCQLLGLDQINRSGAGDGDVISLLGTLFQQMQARATPAGASSVEVEVIEAIEAGEE